MKAPLAILGTMIAAAVGAAIYFNITPYDVLVIWPSAVIYALMIA